jgi:hypothetical protein
MLATTQEAKVGGSRSKSGLGKKHKTLLGKKKKTKTKSKRAGDFTQVVEHLPSKHKALSSSPSTTKEKEP